MFAAATSANDPKRTFPSPLMGDRRSAGRSGNRPDSALAERPQGVQGWNAHFYGGNPATGGRVQGDQLRPSGHERRHRPDGRSDPAVPLPILCPVIVKRLQRPVTRLGEGASLKGANFPSLAANATRSEPHSLSGGAQAMGIGYLKSCNSPPATQWSNVPNAPLFGLVDKIEGHRGSLEPLGTVIDGPDAVGFRQSIH